MLFIEIGGSMSFKELTKRLFSIFQIWGIVLFNLLKWVYAKSVNFIETRAVRHWAISNLKIRIYLFFISLFFGGIGYYFIFTHHNQNVVNAYFHAKGLERFLDKNFDLDIQSLSADSFHQKQLFSRLLVGMKVINNDLPSRFLKAKNSKKAESHKQPVDYIVEQLVQVYKDIVPQTTKSSLSEIQILPLFDKLILKIGAGNGCVEKLSNDVENARKEKNTALARRHLMALSLSRVPSWGDDPHIRFVQAAFSPQVIKSKNKQKALIINFAHAAPVGPLIVEDTDEEKLPIEEYDSSVNDDKKRRTSSNKPKNENASNDQGTWRSRCLTPNINSLINTYYGSSLDAQNFHLKPFSQNLFNLFSPDSKTVSQSQLMSAYLKMLDRYPVDISKEKNNPILFTKTASGKKSLKDENYQKFFEIQQTYMKFLATLLESVHGDQKVKEAQFWRTLFVGPEQLVIFILTIYSVVLMSYRLIGRLTSNKNLDRDLNINNADAKLTETKFWVVMSKLGYKSESQGENIKDLLGWVDRLRERTEAERWMIRQSALLITSVGFIGTVRGIMGALPKTTQVVEAASSGGSEFLTAFADVTQTLGLAFGTTLLALLLGGAVGLLNAISAASERHFFDKWSLKIEAVYKKLP